jgi:signal transduction histidine kinase
VANTEHGGGARRKRARLRALTAAPAHITDLAERRVAQLVAVVTLVLFALTALSASLGVLMHLDALLARMPALCALLAWHALTYAVNRSRRYRLAALLLCLGPIWSNTAVGLADANDPIWYAFMPVSALLASTLLAFRQALFVTILSVLATGFVIAHAGAAMNRDHAALTLAFVIFFSAIVLATARFRAWVERGRRSELLALERHLAEAQRMEALGRLAAGVAHDFNNFLTVIQGNVELARRDHDSPTLAEIEIATARATELISRLLAFARQQPSSPTTLRLDEVISNLEPILVRLAGNGIELTLALASRFPVDADPVQLEQILLNLVANARDAMPRGGALVVSTRDVSVNAEQESAVRPGDYAVLSMRDEGIGMDPATLARAFEPFFSTKEQGKGSGLGLATVRGIATRSGGGVEVDSQLGRGTTFHVFLPRSPSETPLASPGLVAARSS